MATEDPQADLEPRLMLARWVHGELPPEAVPALAARALSAGCTSAALVQLAGESGRVTRRDIEPLVRRCAGELGFAYPAPDDASAWLVNHWAKLIADGGAHPYDGAKRI